MEKVHYYVHLFVFSFSEKKTTKMKEPHLYFITVPLCYTLFTLLNPTSLFSFINTHPFFSLISPQQTTTHHPPPPHSHHAPPLPISPETHPLHGSELSGARCIGPLPWEATAEVALRCRHRRRRLRRAQELRRRDPRQRVELRE